MEEQAARERPRQIQWLESEFGAIRAQFNVTFA